MTNDGEFQVWDTVSRAWTEMGLEPADYPGIAQKLQEAGATWPQVRAIALRDVCGAFAVDAFLIFPCMLWMIMPDGGYNDDFLRHRMQQWKQQPLWLHFLNPLRLLGYPVALLCSISIVLRLQRALDVAWAQAKMDSDDAATGKAARSSRR